MDAQVNSLFPSAGLQRFTVLRPKGKTQRANAWRKVSKHLYQRGVPACRLLPKLEIVTPLFRDLSEGDIPHAVTGKARQRQDPAVFRRQGQHLSRMRSDPGSAEFLGANVQQRFRESEKGEGIGIKRVMILRNGCFAISVDAQSSAIAKGENLSKTVGRKVPGFARALSQ